VRPRAGVLDCEEPAYVRAAAGAEMIVTYPVVRAAGLQRNYTSVGIELDNVREVRPVTVTLIGVMYPGDRGTVEAVEFLLSGEQEPTAPLGVSYPKACHDVEQSRAGICPRCLARPAIGSLHTGIHNLGCTRFGFAEVGTIAESVPVEASGQATMDRERTHNHLREWQALLGPRAPVGIPNYCRGFDCPGLPFAASETTPHPTTCLTDANVKDENRQQRIRYFISGQTEPPRDSGGPALWGQILTDAQRADLRERERNALALEAETMRRWSEDAGANARDLEAANARIAQLEHDLAFARECELPQAVADERAAIVAWLRRTDPLVHGGIMDQAAIAIEAGDHK